MQGILPGSSNVAPITITITHGAYLRMPLRSDVDLETLRSPRKICDRKARCAASLQGVWAARPHTHKTALAKARAALNTAGCGNSFECLGSAWPQWQ